MPHLANKAYVAGKEVICFMQLLLEPCKFPRMGNAVTKIDGQNGMECFVPKIFGLQNTYVFLGGIFTSHFCKFAKEHICIEEETCNHGQS